VVTTAGKGTAPLNVGAADQVGAMAEAAVAGWMMSFNLSKPIRNPNLRAFIGLFPSCIYIPNTKTSCGSNTIPREASIHYLVQRQALRTRFCILFLVFKHSVCSPSNTLAYPRILSSAKMGCRTSPNRNGSVEPYIFPEVRPPGHQGVRHRCKSPTSSK